MNYNNVWNPPFYCIPLIHLSVPLSIHIYMIQEAVFSFIYFLCLLLDICSSTWTMWSFFFLTLKKTQLASILIRTPNLGKLYFMILSSLPHQIFGITFCLWNMVCFHDSYTVSSTVYLPNVLTRYFIVPFIVKEYFSHFHFVWLLQIWSSTGFIHLISDYLTRFSSYLYCL